MTAWWRTYGPLVMTVLLGMLGLGYLVGGIVCWATGATAPAASWLIGGGGLLVVSVMRGRQYRAERRRARHRAELADRLTMVGKGGRWHPDWHRCGPGLRADELNRRYGGDGEAPP